MKSASRSTKERKKENRRETKEVSISPSEGMDVVAVVVVAAVAVDVAVMRRRSSKERRNDRPSGADAFKRGTAVTNAAVW